MNIQSENVITKTGLSVDAVLDILFKRVDTNRYLQPMFAIASFSRTTIPLNTYNTAQYVTLPVADLVKYNNHAQNVIAMENNSLKTFDGFRYIMFYLYHLNATSPVVDHANSFDKYERIAKVSDDSIYIGTGLTRIRFNTWDTPSTNYTHDSTEIGILSFNHLEDDLLNFQFYISQPTKINYDIDRIRAYIIALPLENE